MGGREHRTGGLAVPERAPDGGGLVCQRTAEANFDQNTAHFADRLEKLPGTTWDVLSRYPWSYPEIEPLCTKPAIDAWIGARFQFVDVVFADTQVCVRKTAPDPDVRDMAFTCLVTTD